MAVSSVEVDIHVGTRMRRRREALGISQGRLGRHLGMQYAQIQKFEKGTNRIGAGRLYQIADFLGVPPGWFFEGFDLGDSATPASAGPSQEELLMLTEAFIRIEDPETRASVTALAISLSER